MTSIPSQSLRAALPSLLLPCAALLLLVACSSGTDPAPILDGADTDADTERNPGDVTTGFVTDGEGGGGSADGDRSDATPSGGSDDATGDSDADADSDGQPSGPVCGNGIIEQGQQCDDGANNSDTEPDACRTNCRLPRCGDGVVDSDEECDDGSGNSNSIPNACRRDCTLPRCRDGVRDTGEECDLGERNGEEGSLCSSECTFVIENACPNHDVIELVDDGQALPGAFAWRVSGTLTGGASQPAVVSPCDDAEHPSSSAVRFTADQGGRFDVIITESTPANITLWAQSHCQSLPIACEIDFVEDGRLMQFILEEGDNVFVLVADDTGDGGAWTLEIRRVGTLVD